jgi:transposase
MGQRRRFTPEFKRQAVQLLNAGPRPAAEIARELGIPRNPLYKWQKVVAVHGGAFPGSGRQAEPAAELTRLRRELARVTEERDILKKAAVDSTGERNTGFQYSRGRLKSQGLPRPLIQS